MGIKILQIHKRSSYEFKYIQDKYAINLDKRTFAIADGTTQSFNSEIWAEIITKYFVATPLFNVNELIKFFEQQVQEYKSVKVEFSSNPAKASLEKSKFKQGATTTFIGLQFKSDDKIEIISCGDSNLFLVNPNNDLIAFPFTDYESLDANNSFINTEQLVQNEVDRTFFNQKLLNYNQEDTVILATDALSRLILKKPSTISEILNIQSFNQLHDFCNKYWESKELQEDDITALIIPANKSRDINSIYPPIDFSFPREKEIEFKPNYSNQSLQSNFKEMEINEIRDQLNVITKDFQQVKSKLKLYEMLLFIVISLAIATLFYLIVFHNTPDLKKSTKEIEIQQTLNEKSKLLRLRDREIVRLNGLLKSRDTAKINTDKVETVEQDTVGGIKKVKDAKNIKK